MKGNILESYRSPEGDVDSACTIACTEKIGLVALQFFAVKR